MRVSSRPCLETPSNLVPPPRWLSTAAAVPGWAASPGVDGSTAAAACAAGRREHVQHGQSATTDRLHSQIHAPPLLRTCFMAGRSTVASSARSRIQPAMKPLLAHNKPPTAARLIPAAATPPSRSCSAAAGACCGAGGGWLTAVLSPGGRAWSIYLQLQSGVRAEVKLRCHRASRPPSPPRSHHKPHVSSSETPSPSFLRRRMGSATEG